MYFLLIQVDPVRSNFSIVTVQIRRRYKMVTKVMQTQAKDTIISTTNNRHNYVRHLRNLLAIDRRHSIYSQHSQQDLHLQPIGQQRMRVKIRNSIVRTRSRHKLVVHLSSVTRQYRHLFMRYSTAISIFRIRHRVIRRNLNRPPLILMFSYYLRYGPRHFPAKPHVAVVETVTHQIQSGVRGRSGTVKR